MSELKSVYIDRTGDWCRSGNDTGAFYLKSEADKVIAELKAQKSQAEDDCAYWKMSEGNAVNAMHETEEYAMQLYNELRHEKFKRCLAMAKWCKMSARENDTRMCLPEKQKFTRHEEYLYFIGYYHKWRKRWLELAEQFKEAK